MSNWQWFAIGGVAIFLACYSSIATKLDRITRLLEIANDQRNDERIERDGSRFD